MSDLELADVFKAFDHDGSGHIEYAELEKEVIAVCCLLIHDC